MNARPMHVLRVAIAAALSAAGAAHATSCAVDPVPAATLLVPNFQVDLDGCATGGRTTTFWVRNVSETHQLVQVTMWGEYGVPVAGFPIYLPPMSARHVDLADVLCRGRVPSTGRAVSPISPFGPNAQPNFPGCNSTPSPDGGIPVANQFSPAFLADVQLRLTGNRSPTTNVCFGTRHGDNVARGYLTIDDVGACTTLMHYDPGFMQTVLEFDNAFVGGFEYVDPTDNFAQGAPAVAIEAQPPGVFFPGEWTFYGRLAGFSAIDRREPLPSSWAFPIARGGVFGRETDVVVWRETPRVNLGGQSCNVPPAPMPLLDFGQSVFDASGESAAEAVVFPGEIPPLDTPIGFATQVVPAAEIESSSDFGADVGQGTGYVNLGYVSGVGAPPGPYGQSWVGTITYSEGRFSEFAVGTALDSMCDPGATSPANVSGPLPVNPNTRDFLFSNGMEP